MSEKKTDETKKAKEEKLYEAIEEKQEEMEQETPAEDISELEAARLKSDLAEAVKARDEYLDMARRIQADFENFKRRNESVRKDAYEEGQRNAITRLLEVADNLDRAVSAPDGNIKDGIAMILKQFLGILEAMDVKEIEAQGLPFDPAWHNAVMQEEAENAESGTVTDVMQKGYAMRDKVLRYSMVKVAK